MALREFERRAYLLFGSRAARHVEHNPQLKRSLQRAHIYVRPEVYLSAIYLMMAVSVVATVVPLLLLMMASASGLIEPAGRTFFYLLSAPLILPVLIYMISLVAPDLKATARARDIDAKLPYALNFITTMSSAGATPNQVFGALARQPVYGGVAHEAAWISRDLHLLGTDIVTALTRAIERSPSAKFQDLLQGAITTLTSGGDMKRYFLNKSEQFLYENRQEQKKFIDSLGVLAESFVTVVVAAPLFLIVILSVMTSLGGSPSQTLLIGYTLIFLMIPLSQTGFAWTVRVMTPEA